MRKRTWTRLMAGWCAAAMVAVANGEDAVVEKDMVVIATRDARDAATIPANVTVLTGEELRAGARLSVVDALRDLAGVQVRSITGNPVSAEIGMRGFGENSHGRVLALLDGRRLNRPDMAAINWLQLSPNQVERIEVLRGGASALYGDHAVGGVVNIVTRQGREEPVTEIGVEAGSFGTVAVRAGTWGKLDALSYAVAADRIESDGYRDRTGYLSQGLGARLGYALSPANDLFLALGWRDAGFELPGDLTLEQMRSDRKSSDSMEDESAILYLNAHAGLRLGRGEAARFDADVFWGRKAIESDMASWVSYADNTIDTLGATLAYTLEFPFGRCANAVTLGADYTIDTMDVDRYSDADRNVRALSAELEKHMLGAYVRHEASPNDSLTFAWAGRYETSEFKGEAEAGGMVLYNDSDRHRAAAADVSVVKTFAGRSKAYAKAGTLYRYPFIDEQISYFGYGTDAFHTDIDPEQGWNAELGGRWRHDAGWLDLAVFHVDMKDEIAWNAMSFRNENFEKTQRQGVETAFRYAPAGWPVRLSGNYTYTEAVFTGGDNDGKDIPLVPRHKATLSAGVALPLGLDASVVSTYVGSSRLGGDNANARDKLPEYIVVDFVLRYVSSVVTGLEAHVAVDNVLNEKYASLGYAGWMTDAYYPSPEIGVRGGLSYRF